MSLRNGIALTCIAIPAVAMIVVGVTYFTASEIMPYHKEFLEVPWSELPPNVRAMLVGFLHIMGANQLTVGLALVLLVVIPLRRGDSWARWAILAVGLPLFSFTTLVATRISLSSGARTPWQLAVVLLVLFLVGIALVNPKPATQRAPEADAP